MFSFVNVNEKTTVILYTNSDEPYDKIFSDVSIKLRTP